MINWTVNEWSNVIFLDEKRFNTSIKRKPKIKRRRGECSYQSVHSNLTDISINTICFLKYNQPVLVKKISNNFNSLEFKNVLNQFFGECQDEIILYMDKCPLHFSDCIMSFFDLHRNINVINTAPVSPDLNCIENVFSLLDRKKDCYLLNNFISTEIQLFMKINQLAREIDQSTLNKLVESMPSRINACKDRLGMITNY